MDRRIAILLLVALAVLSAFVVYPVVHEAGHYFTGRLLGAEVKEVVWTPLGGKRPHVLFGQTPGPLIPWINAGGLVLPTLVGGAAMIFWLCYGERLGYWWRAVIVIPAVVLLFGNLGSLTELFEPPDLLNHHLYPLAHRLGLGRFSSILLQLAPALLSGVLLFLCLHKNRNFRRPSSPSSQRE